MENKIEINDQAITGSVLVETHYDYTDEQFEKAKEFAKENQNDIISEGIAVATEIIFLMQKTMELDKNIDIEVTDSTTKEKYKFKLEKVI